MNEDIKENKSGKRVRGSREGHDSVGCKGVISLKGEQGSN